ncbi:hypothetical protein ACIRSU_00570 [Streptomyces sp. NPDC101160]|uniref:hypothetical protein n=1 Tax=Streptomyces sp. NPDC101160 TaxID=3366118 RepID=UPI00382E9F0A
MDVDKVEAELYGLKPGDFVAARDAYVAEARKAKDPAAAKAIAALRRPALAAWVANLLACRRPEEVRQFLVLGETLREAHRMLDAEQLRTASRQRHQLVATLARTAAALAGEAGQPVSDTVLSEVEQTLQGVLAHADVAELWAKGRLAKVPEAAVDFAAVAPEVAPVRVAAPVEQSTPKERPARAAALIEQPMSKQKPAHAATPATQPTPKPKEKPSRAEEQRLRDLERARTAVAEADADVVRHERELGEAHQAQRAAAAKAKEVAEQVRRLEHELQEARQAELDQDAAAAKAGAEAKAAERALERARRLAERARREVERLERQAG